MIEAKELRIGNWVLFNPLQEVYDFCPVKIINPKNVVVIHRGHELQLFEMEFQPIPLTTEILEKCLTKVNDKEFRIEIPVEWSKTHHTEYWFYVILYEYYATGESHVGWRPWVQQGTKAKVEEIFLWGYLEYVHQLQNFYHSVCQSELLIKL